MNQASLPEDQAATELLDRIRAARPEFGPGDSSVVSLTLLSGQELSDWLAGASEADRRWIQANGFKARPGEVIAIPDESGGIARALAGSAEPDSGKDNRFHLGSILQKLPTGNYRLTNQLGSGDRDEAALAALLSTHRPGKGSCDDARLVRLAAPEGLNKERTRSIAESELFIREMINSPASKMTPGCLEAIFAGLADEHGASFNVIKGSKLAENCPLTHAVGRSSEHEPRLLELRWGSSGPLATLIGKGVCFDTGGLNMKSTPGMALMKKDMAGAAVVAGLCRTIMDRQLPFRIRVLVPVAENSISGRSMRPGDVLVAANGTRVEITNTDAEGRLLLADALSMASEEEPDFLATFATLTGAARVALGPELVPFFTTDDQLAGTLAEAGRRSRDPLWRMPLWKPYYNMLESEVADIANSPSSGFAGSLVAALFLLRFVKQPDRFVHFDIYGWQPKPAPARPKGGCGQAWRATLETLEAILC